MIYLKSVAAVLIGMLTLAAAADEPFGYPVTDCNGDDNGFEALLAKDIQNKKFSDDRSHAEHVWVARNGNKGKGNDGESVNIVFSGGTQAINCISTAAELSPEDADPGQVGPGNGTLELSPTFIIQSIFAPEYDPDTNLLSF